MEREGQREGENRKKRVAYEGAAKVVAVIVAEEDNMVEDPEAVMGVGVLWWNIGEMVWADARGWKAVYGVAGVAGEVAAGDAGKRWTGEQSKGRELYTWVDPVQ